MERIEVICVGSELLHDMVNTDINFISKLMAGAGYSILRNVIVPDDKDEIKSALTECIKRSDIIIITGGLGPTFDDLTREIVADFFKRKLVFSKNIWKKIEQRFRKRGIVPSLVNKKQAYVIEKSHILKNEVGTAPGMILEEKNKIIILLPGPPVELVPIVKKEVLPYIKKKFGQKKDIQYFRFGFAGVCESGVEERSSEIISSYEKKGKIEFTILAHPAFIEILVKIFPPDEEKKIQEIEKKLKEKFRDDFIGLNPPTLPEILGNVLKKRKLKLALAESCTGGLAGKLITDISGSSEFFQGSFVTYGNVLKKRVLKVPKTVLKKDGAVSKKSAIAMAKGAKKVGKSDVSIAFTGVAGPAGGTEEKPVGLVWIAIGLPKNRYCAERYVFSGNRSRVRERAALTGIDFLRRKLIEKQ